MPNTTIDILLVEDNPSDLMLTLNTLEEHGISNRIEVVRDGAAALDFLFCTGEYAHRRIDDRPKVVLLDLKLPRVKGLDVLAQIKNDPRTKAIPVVVLTSSDQERDIVQSYENGVNSYVVKPIDYEAFTEAVRDTGVYWVQQNQPPFM